jgi:phage N-6-adenine-methyltransferase
MINKGLFTSDSSEWETPQWLFRELDEEFNFRVDVAATYENTKCEIFYDKHADSLKSSWSLWKRIWCNPPYGSEVAKWVQKAYEESLHPLTEVIVMLLPARTDTRWFHDYIYGKSEIRFLKGRLKFSNSKNSAPFPSMVVIFKNQNREENDHE